MTSLGDMFVWAKGFGIYDFFLPFILAFAIFYGLLSKTKVFGNPTEKAPRTINLVISLGLALYITLFVLLPNNISISTFLARYFGSSMIIILGLIGFLMVFYLMMNILKPGADWDWTRWGWIILIIAVIFVVGIFISSGGGNIIPGFKLLNISIDPGILAVIVVIILTGLVIYFLASSDEKRVKL
jgi:hypothetical protein